MQILLSVRWMPFLALDVVLLAFVLLRVLEDRMNWSLVILLALVLGAGIGVLFASEGNAWLLWVDFLGTLYIRLLKLLVSPVIFLSIVSGIISLRGRANAGSLGLRSAFWLLLQAALAILLSLLAGQILNIGSDATALFRELDTLDESTVSAYAGLTQPFHQVLENLFPENVVGDFANNNVPALIITGVAVAAAYLAVAEKEGEELVRPFSRLIDAARKIVFKILEVVIDLTPYAVLCLIAGAASRLLESRESMLQLLLLTVVIYAVCLVHTYLLGGLIIWGAAKLSPLRFFRKTGYGALPEGRGRRFRRSCGFYRFSRYHHRDAGLHLRMAGSAGPVLCSCSRAFLERRGLSYPGGHGLFPFHRQRGGSRNCGGLGNCALQCHRSSGRGGGSDDSHQHHLGYDPHAG